MGRPTILVAIKIIACKIFLETDDIVLRAEGSYFNSAFQNRTFHVKHPEDIWVKYFHSLIKKEALEKQRL